MTRYFVERQPPRTWWEHEEYLPSSQPKTMTVLESDDVINTGLLDKDGNPIKKRTKDDIGFIRAQP